MKHTLLIAMLGSTALMSSGAWAQTPNQAAPTMADCDRLIVVIEQNKIPNLPVTLEQARVFKRDANLQACRDNLTRVSQAGAAGGITVQQGAPTIQVDQPDPRVTVKQQEPTVTVHQAVPEIIVRQKPPTITVQQEQPEVIVRMPEPDVNVATAQPQVSVNMPKPQVQVVPAQQPQVNVNAAQPQVMVQRPQGDANVQVNRAQPKVTVERTGEPKVVVNPAAGQPQVRVERMGADADATADRPAAANAPTPPAAVAAVTPPAAAVGPVRRIPVSQLLKKDLYNARGNQLGDVEQVVMSQDNKAYVVIGAGGFLGIGEKHVLVPLDRIAMRGDRLMIRGVTEDEIKRMPTWDRNNRAYREMQPNYEAPLGLMD